MIPSTTSLRIHFKSPLASSFTARSEISQHKNILTRVVNISFFPYLVLMMKKRSLWKRLLHHFKKKYLGLKEE
jgi:hypothetical protein